MTHPLKRVAAVLYVTAVILLAIPLVIAFSADRNGHTDCDLDTPVSLASSDIVVQNKHRVTLFPLVLECAYTIEQNPLESDYTVTRRDLGTAWWAAAPLAAVAGTAVWAAGRRRPQV